MNSTTDFRGKTVQFRSNSGLSGILAHYYQSTAKIAIFLKAGGKSHVTPAPRRIMKKVAVALESYSGCGPFPCSLAFISSIIFITAASRADESDSILKPRSIF